MPLEVFEEIKYRLPKHIGVYIWNGKYLVLVKRAKKQKVEDIDILKNSLIRSLYREACKVRECKNIELMNNLKRRLARLEKESIEDKRNFITYRSAIREELGRTKFSEFKCKF